jgi:hypothetical protein
MEAKGGHMLVAMIEYDGGMTNELDSSLTEIYILRSYNSCLGYKLVFSLVLLFNIQLLKYIPDVSSHVDAKVLFREIQQCG